MAIVQTRVLSNHDGEPSAIRSSTRAVYVTSVHCSSQATTPSSTRKRRAAALTASRENHGVAGANEGSTNAGPTGTAVNLFKLRAAARRTALRAVSAVEIMDIRTTSDADGCERTGYGMLTVAGTDRVVLGLDGARRATQTA